MLNIPTEHAQGGRRIQSRFMCNNIIYSTVQRGAVRGLYTLFPAYFVYARRFRIIAY